MPTDTREQYRMAGRAPGLPLSIGRKAGKVPGVYESGTSGNKPGPTQSPARSGLTMVQTTPINAAPAAPKPASRPNAGGTMTRGGVTTMVAPSATQNTDPNRAGSGGSITRRGLTTMVAPTPARVPAPAPQMAIGGDDSLPSSPISPTPAAPVSAPTTRAAQQTEAANPLTGDTNRQAGGTTAPINPGQAMGFSRAGGGVPAGQDAMPAAAPAEQTTQQKLRSSMKGTQNNLRGVTSGGTGLYKRSFTNPKSAGLYDGYVKRLFGDTMSV